MRAGWPWSHRMEELCAPMCAHSRHKQAGLCSIFLSSSLKQWQLEESKYQHMFEYEHLIESAHCYIHLYKCYILRVKFSSFTLSRGNSALPKWAVDKDEAWMEKIVDLSMTNYRIKFYYVSLVQSRVLQLFEHHFSGFLPGQLKQRSIPCSTACQTDQTK